MLLNDKAPKPYQPLKHILKITVNKTTFNKWQWLCELHSPIKPPTIPTVLQCIAHKPGKTTHSVYSSPTIANVMVHSDTIATW